MKKLGVGASIFLSVCIASSLSASPRPTCDRSSSQPDLDACAYEDLEAAEKEMQSVYQGIVEKYASNALLLERLARAQQSWMNFREDDWKAQFACPNFNTQLCWGPQAFIKVNVRRMEQTKERTRSLRNLLENGPGR
ncbi:lysozyme inhibitor LprI family protein [Massilia sp. BSC265]|uniref:lysozyme inhibitor LprI family protein n=1 Tax=Massilia sp. BSC265 TaxID=1549812 RepID=UPI00126A1930|nr:lysozyme inhibitor LprI family protein [Massilia sp. BSC265]